MQADPVDPRDIAWEIDEPAYRVYFWDGRRGWASDEWRLTGTDVGEVLAWAEAHADGRYFTVGVEIEDDAAGRGLLRLHGWEPTSNSVPPAFVATADRD